MSSLIYINQSLIKSFKICENPYEWKEKYLNREKKDPKSNALSLGSLTDYLLFTPNELDNKFVLFKDKYPSDKVEEIIEAIFEDGVEFNDDVIVEYAQAHGFGASTWKKETIIKKIKEDGEAYYNFRINNSGKIPFNETQFITANCIVDRILTGENTKHFFNNDLEKISQRVIYSIIDDIPVVGTPDLYLIDHEKKSIILIDLKTSRNAYRFRQDAIKFGYPLQASYYSNILENEYQGYTVDRCLNIVGDTNNCNVYVYEYNYQDLNIEKYGNKWHKGWLYYLKQIDWHIKNDIWDSTEEQTNNGVIKISIY